MMNSTERSSCENTFGKQPIKLHAEMLEISMISVIYTVVNSTKDPSLPRLARLVPASKDWPRAGHLTKQSHLVWAKRSRYILSTREWELQACNSRMTILTWPPCIHLKPTGLTKEERLEAWLAEKSWRFKTLVKMKKVMRTWMAHILIRSTTRYLDSNWILKYRNQGTDDPKSKNKNSSSSLLR